MPNFVQRHQSQLYLLPPDLRDWLPEDDLAHFVVEAVERVPLERFQVNERGTGSAQYHPRMMLALLVYCYANGIFGSRRIERATYRDIGVRYVAANCHPDHDTICTFRRSNFEAVAEAFLQVLLLAKELKLLRVGTVSVDGTKVDRTRTSATASAVRGRCASSCEARSRGCWIRRNADGRRAGRVCRRTRRDKLRAKLDRFGTACAGACGLGAGGVRAQGGGAGAAYGIAQGSAHQATDGSAGGEGADQPDGRGQCADRRSRHHEYRQAYNAQAAVDADGSQLVLGSRVSVCASDRNELVADVEAGGVGRGGSGTGGQWLRDGQTQLAGRGVEVLVATGAEGQRRRHDFRPEPPEQLEAAGGLDQVVQEKMALRSTGRITVCASRRWSRCSGS